MKIVIFDLDGTLLDTVDLHAQAWQETFEHFGKIYSFEEIRRQIGKGADQLLPEFFSDQELKQNDQQIRDYKTKHFKENFHNKVKPFPKVRKLLEQLKMDDVTICLASSAEKEDLLTFKKIAGINDLIDLEVSADDIQKSKPYPDIYIALLAKLPSREHSKAVVVGDTPYDVEAAGKAGLPTIGLLCGGFSKDDLLHAGCIAIFKSPEDLYEYYQDFKRLW